MRKKIFPKTLVGTFQENKYLARITLYIVIVYIIILLGRIFCSELFFSFFNEDKSSAFNNNNNNNNYKNNNNNNNNKYNDDDDDDEDADDDEKNILYSPFLYYARDTNSLDRHCNVGQTCAYTYLPTRDKCTYQL